MNKMCKKEICELIVTQGDYATIKCGECPFYIHTEYTCTRERQGIKKVQARLDANYDDPACL